MNGLWLDFVYTLRTLRKTPIVTGAAIASLALGLGANIAVFTLLNGLMLRPLPIPNAGELFALSTTLPDRATEVDSFSIAMLEQLRSRQNALSGLFAWSGGGMANFEVDGQLYAAAVDTVTGEYFSALGIKPFLGRFITPDDVALTSGQSAQVAVLGYDCWQRRFSSDPRVLGRTLRVDGTPLTIIGVAPPGFAGLQIDAGPDATVPIGYKGTAAFRDPKNTWFQVLGRLQGGVAPQQATAQLTALWPGILATTVPTEYKGKQRSDFVARRIGLQSAATGNSYMRKRLTRPLTMMMVLVGAVLLIACVNLANLMMAKAAARDRELRVRRALGAQPWRLIRSMLMESCLISLSAAVLGLLISWWLSKTLINMFWNGFVRTTVVLSPDFRVLGFTAALALLVSLLFGLAPAVSRQWLQAESSLQSSSRAAIGGIGNLGKSLVSLQAALCIVLVVGAALFATTLQELRSFNPGFKRDRVLMMNLFPQPGAEKIPNRTAYYHEVAEKLATIPGVTGVSYSNNGPLSLELRRTVSSSSGSREQVRAAYDWVGPDFFHLLGMHVLAGRDFTWQDDVNSAKVAILSERLAERLFPGQNPLGQTIDLGPDQDQQGIEVVGIVNNASLWQIQSVRPAAVFMPLMQAMDYDEPMLEISTAGDPHAIMPAARQILEAGRHHYPLRMQTLDDRVDMRLANERILALTSVFLASLALLMGAIGIYGLLSHAVTRRTSEMGVRMALGAQPRELIQLVLGESLRLVAAGIVIGVVVEWALSHLAETMLFHITGRSPLVIIASLATLLLTTLIAAYGPARRAANLDPMKALREE